MFREHFRCHSFIPLHKWRSFDKIPQNVVITFLLVGLILLCRLQSLFSLDMPVLLSFAVCRCSVVCTCRLHLLIVQTKLARFNRVRRFDQSNNNFTQAPHSQHVGLIKDWSKSRLSMCISLLLAPCSIKWAVKFRLSWFAIWGMMESANVERFDLSNRDWTWLWGWERI